MYKHFTETVMSLTELLFFCHIFVAPERQTSMLTGVSIIDSKCDSGCVLESRLVLPYQPPLMVQGQRLRGHYYPLSRKQLEWYLGLSAIVEEVERDQSKIMQVILQNYNNNNNNNNNDNAFYL